MTPSDSASIAPKTLLGLIQAIPADRTAVIAPDQNVRITYGGLRQQIQAVAEALAASGVNRGDRIGIALPNGLPNIVAFLAASVAGTAAPLNPAYKEDEFRFYLEDTNAKVLLLPPDGLDEALRAFDFALAVTEGFHEAAGEDAAVVDLELARDEMRDAEPTAEGRGRVERCARDDREELASVAMHLDGAATGVGDVLLDVAAEPVVAA